MADECSQKWPTHDMIKADTTRCDTAAVTLSIDWSQAVLFCPALLCRQQCTELYCPAYYKVLYRTLPYCTVLYSYGMMYDDVTHLSLLPPPQLALRYHKTVEIEVVLEV